MSQPAWVEEIITKALEDNTFKAELLTDSKAAIEKIIGQSLGAINVKVVQETANSLYLVLPAQANQDELSDEELSFVAGGTSSLKYVGPPNDRRCV